MCPITKIQKSAKSLHPNGVVGDILIRKGEGRQSTGGMWWGKHLLCNILTNIVI